MFFNSLIEIDKHLRSQKTPKRDQVVPKLLELLESIYLKVLNYCEKPQNRLSILENLDLYNNSRNFDTYIKPLLEVDWLKQTLPDKPTSKNQKYYTTDLGKKVLGIFSKDSNTGIKRVPVDSSSIAAIGYDKEALNKEVKKNNNIL